jgi:hypothetical protein
VQAASTNFYLLDLASDSHQLVQEFTKAGLPASTGSMVRTETTFGLNGTAVGVIVEELQSRSQPLEGTASIRFHWKAEGVRCWIDTEHSLLQTEATVISFEGKRGHPLTVTGPLARSAGGGQRGTESGSMGAPTCES